MGLQIGNTNIKDVKIGVTGSDVTYTWTNVADKSIQASGYRDYTFIEGNTPSRIKGTITASPVVSYTMTTYNENGEIVTTAGTSTIEFDTYLKDEYYLKIENGTDYFYIKKIGSDVDLIAGDDYKRTSGWVTFSVTNTQYGTPTSTPTITYQNIKEIYVGSDKIYPITSDWETVWEGSAAINTSRSTGNQIILSGINVTDPIGTYRFTGTATLLTTGLKWTPLDNPINPDKDTGLYIWNKDTTGETHYLYDENSNVLDLSSITYTKDTLDNYRIWIMLTSKTGVNNGNYACIIINNTNLILYTKYNSLGYPVQCQIKITKIEKYIEE